MKAIELRSDTFTQPTPAMRRAMAEAEVGDDQYGEDPTVNRLEKRAAEVVGKDAAVYVPSGMMGNLCGVLSQTERGDEVILGDLAHIVQNEMGSSFVLGSIVPRLVPNRDGLPALEDIGAAIRPQGMFPRTSLLCLENTHNNCGGTVLTAAQTRAAADLAHARGLRVHLDGARIFNAAVALGVDARELTRDVDTVQFCFSKGLAAPVGSILCGDTETIAKARKVRKLLGGAMRQAGVIAAAGVYALEHMVDRLAEDHDNAQALARGLAALPMIDLDPETVETNIVIFRVRGDWLDFARGLKESGVLASVYGERTLRMVTHYGIGRADVDEALARVRHAAAALA